MRRIRSLVALSEGKAHFVPLRELWAVAGLLTDTFPLDRDLVRGPRWARHASNWTRLLLVDHAVTDCDRTAVLTLRDTPWVPAIGAAIVAAAIAPRLPRRVRFTLFAGVGVWVFSGNRASRFVAMRRELQRVAPDAVLVADFLALEPGAGIRWVRDALDTVSDETSFVALVPASGDPRRDVARERLYVRRVGFRRVGETVAGGQDVAILVRP